MKKIITLKPSYATSNTVRFDEDNVTANEGGFLAPATVNGALGKPFVQYLDGDQLNAIGWVPTFVGDMYQTPVNRQGKSYDRREVSGPSIKVTIETA